MMNVRVLALAFLMIATPLMAKKKQKQDLFPDGTPVPAWFSETAKVNTENLGKVYVLTDYGVVNDSTVLQTEAIQKVIDKVAKDGGGVVVVPSGTYLSGSLFFPQGVNLYLEADAVLKGSDRIRDFKLHTTRMEGQTLKYFAALVNADGVDGFTIAGKGTINGNGYNYWEEFWIRRQMNRQCTNLEAMRPRLVYISNSRNVTVQDVHLVNSPFWTNHLYKCEYVRYLDCTILAPTSGLKAPSSDAIDIDVCKNVLVKGCYMSVNDDAVVLKGGKGTWADQDPNNGPNSNIIIEDCTYGKSHGCLTLGSESIHNRNVILRRCKFKDTNRVLWLKMRPDTPQHYEYVTIEDVEGECDKFLVVRPWTQFYTEEKRDDKPLSTCHHILIKGAKVKSKNFFDVGKSDKYQMRDFTFENCEVEDEAEAFNKTLIDNCVTKGLKINGDGY